MRFSRFFIQVAIYDPKIRQWIVEVQELKPRLSLMGEVDGEAIFAQFLMKKENPCNYSETCIFGDFKRKKQFLPLQLISKFCPSHIRISSAKKIT